MSTEDWNYFKNDSSYSRVLRDRLSGGVEMDSALALARYVDATCSGPLRIVDFGSGPGHYYPVIRKHYSKGTVRYLGIDIDAENVRFGNEYFGGDPECEFIVGSVLEPTSFGTSVNCVVSANTLPHVPTLLPLTEFMNRNSEIKYFVFRMLIGSECVQIKKHLSKADFQGMFAWNFQYNNIYSLDYMRELLGGFWELEVKEDHFDPVRLAGHSVPAQENDSFYGNRVSRNVGGMVFKGDVYMPWKFLLGVRRG